MNTQWLSIFQIVFSVVCGDHYVLLGVLKYSMTIPGKCGGIDKLEFQ